MTESSPPPTRIISFLQLCTEEDPRYYPMKERPWVYEFSNGRRFVRPPGQYVGGFALHVEGADPNEPDENYLIGTNGQYVLST